MASLISFVLNVLRRKVGDTMNNLKGEKTRSAAKVIVSITTTYANVISIICRFRHEAYVVIRLGLSMSQRRRLSPCFDQGHVN